MPISQGVAFVEMESDILVQVSPCRKNWIKSAVQRLQGTHCTSHYRASFFAVDLVVENVPATGNRFEQLAITNCSRDASGSHVYPHVAIFLDRRGDLLIWEWIHCAICTFSSSSSCVSTDTMKGINDRSFPSYTTRIVRVSYRVDNCCANWRFLGRWMWK